MSGRVPSAPGYKDIRSGVRNGRAPLPEAPPLRSIAKAVLLAAALCLGCSAPGIAQEEASRTSETYQDWRVSCGARQDTGRSCLMRQDRLRENGQRLLAMEVRGRQDGDAIATFLLPFGILLEAGVTPRVDDRPAMDALSFRTCLPSGCLAVFPLDMQTLELLSAGSSLKLRVMTVAGEQLTFPVSLRGFTAAFRRVADPPSR